MEDPVTVRDMMNRSFVGVSEADSVAGAAQLMREESVLSAVVLRGSEPIGMFDEDGLLELVADCRDPAETPISEAMRPAVTIDVDQRLEHAVGAMTTDGIRHLLVEENGEVVGSLSEHDIITAHAVLTTYSEPMEIEVGPSFSGEADPDNEVYSTQGICENCGALTRELSAHSGQLVCPDCLTM